jgi:hypothetical protein
MIGMSLVDGKGRHPSSVPVPEGQSGYQTTVEPMDATSDTKYGDDY